MIFCQLSGDRPYFRGPLRKRQSSSEILSSYAPALMCVKLRHVGSEATFSACFFHCCLCCLTVISTGRKDDALKLFGSRILCRSFFEYGSASSGGMKLPFSTSLSVCSVGRIPRAFIRGGCSIGVDVLCRNRSKP